jgi:hypothetical protein
MYYNQETTEDITKLKNRTLEKDGFCILYNENIKEALNKLPNGYQFMNYVYRIKNASLSTFHRDVTSSKNIYKTKYKVYTLILYKYDGELLSVCPKSDKSYPFVNSRIININGPKNTAILFDSDLLHAGRFNNCKNRDVIQYKICHFEDLDKLKHLENINVSKNEECNNNKINLLIRKLSYFFEFPINYFLYPLMIKKHDNNFIGKLQSFIPINFYNNT